MSTNLIDVCKSDEIKIQGNNFYKSKNYQQAIKCYTQSIHLNSDNLFSYLNRAQCYLQLKHYEECIKDCNKVLLKDMENPKARHRKGRALMGLGGVHNLQNAIFDFQKVLENESKNEIVQLDLNQAFQQLEELNKENNSQSMNDNDESWQNQEGFRNNVDLKKQQMLRLFDDFSDKLDQLLCVDHNVQIKQLVDKQDGSDITEYLNYGLEILSIIEQNDQQLDQYQEQTLQRIIHKIPIDKNVKQNQQLMKDLFQKMGKYINKYEMSIYERQKVGSSSMQLMVDEFNVTRYLDIVSKDSLQQQFQQIASQFRTKQSQLTSHHKLNNIKNINIYLAFKKLFASKQRQKQQLFEEMKNNIQSNFKEKKSMGVEIKTELQNEINKGYQMLLELEQELFDSLEKSDQYQQIVKNYDMISELEIDEHQIQLKKSMFLDNYASKLFGQQKMFLVKLQTIDDILKQSRQTLELLKQLLKIKDIDNEQEFLQQIKKQEQSNLSLSLKVRTKLKQLQK